jgi:hypothetical protein
MPLFPSTPNCSRVSAQDGLEEELLTEIPKANDQESAARWDVTYFIFTLVSLPEKTFSRLA